MWFYFKAGSKESGVEWSVASEEKYRNGYRLVIKHNKASIIGVFFSCVEGSFFVIARFAFYLADEFRASFPTNNNLFAHISSAFVIGHVHLFQILSGWGNYLSQKFAICILPIINLVYPPKLCITIVFAFSWDDCNAQEKLKTMLCKILRVKQVALWAMWK